MSSAAMGSAAYKEDVMLTIVKNSCQKSLCSSADKPKCCTGMVTEAQVEPKDCIQSSCQSVLKEAHLHRKPPRECCHLFPGQKLLLLVFSHNFVFLFETVYSSCEIQVTVKAFRQ